MISMRYSIAIVVIILILWKIMYNLKKHISANNTPKSWKDVHGRLGRIEIYMATLIIIKLLASLYNLSSHEEKKIS